MSDRHSRRGFMGAAAAALAATIGWPKEEAAQTTEAVDNTSAKDADLIVTNANVYTVDSRSLRAEAFAVKNGRFLAVGRSDDIGGLRGKNTTMMDAKQMTVVPGFIDCH